MANIVKFSLPTLFCRDYPNAKQNEIVQLVEQYALLAIHSDYYPVLHRGIAIANDSIWLNTGEVWKYGITCIGELNLYPMQVYYYDGKYLLDYTVLRFNREFDRRENKNIQLSNFTRMY